MKKYLLFILSVFILPTLVFAANQNKTEASASSLPQTDIARPYVVEDINQRGEVTGEFKGLSRETDPFLISKELGASPYLEDNFSAFPDIKMNIGSKISLYRAPEITIRDGKKSKLVRSWKNTVGEVFDEQGIEIGTEDKVNFSLNTEAEHGMMIVIVRVARTTVIENKPIPYIVKKKEDKNLDEGKTRVEVKGVDGVKAFSYLVIREDGEQVSKTLMKTEITKEPVNEVLIIGTKPVITVRCKYNDLVLDASMKYGVKPNEMCTRMMRESNGNPDSIGANGKYNGLYQYEAGFWNSVSAKAGYSGANIFDAKAQIYTTAWAWSHGYRGRWPAN